MEMVMYEWIGSVLFNVAARNEEYMEEMEEYLNREKNEEREETLANLY